MTAAPDPHAIQTLEQLESIFDGVSEAALKKELPYVHPAYRAMIEASPFAVLASVGADGMDASPRGDPAGFVVMQDEKTLLLPERRGNNRVDSLRNILIDPRVGLLFLIPGVGETLRVNGRATITADPVLLERLAIDGKPPRCVVVIHVDAVYFQCSRAIVRAKLWQTAPERASLDVPTAGAMLAAVTAGGIDGGKYDRELPARVQSTLY